MSAIDRREGTTPNPVGALLREQSAPARGLPIVAVLLRRAVTSWCSPRGEQSNSNRGSKVKNHSSTNVRIARRCFASSRLVLLRTRMVPLVTRSNLTAQRTQADPTFPRWAIALVAPTTLRARLGWRRCDHADRRRWRDRFATRLSEKCTGSGLHYLEPARFRILNGMRHQ